MIPLPVLCAALVTPVNSSGEVSHHRLLSHARWTLDNGSDGIVLFGTTGESASFGLVERQTALDKLIAGGIDPAKIIVGTGCCSIQDTVTLTRHTIANKCAGVLMHPPFFFNAPGENGIFAFYQNVIERLDQNNAQIVLYHFPEITGASITLSLARRLLDAFPDVIVGLKDSTGSLESMVGFTREFPALKVFSGDEHLLWPLLEAGGYGAISVVSNLTPNLLADVASGYHDNSQKAQIAQKVLVGLWVDTLLNFPLSEALKTLVAASSADQGWARVKPPLEPLSRSLTHDLHEKTLAYQSFFPANLGKYTKAKNCDPCSLSK